MQLGFVIDHTRCIGCHACTVACKAENDVPVGSFRTWVKYTEKGEFPDVRRSFAVLRCNQCTSAPCVSICPVHAIEKRDDGIVNIDPQACIGCKACLQGCPYDALYINDSSGTAEKCHFCAHRTELGLAPACAVVCPTEAIIPGDFHDPDSKVSRMRSEMDLSVRKEQAGTGPNVFYRDVADAGIDPLQTNASGGYLWSGQREGDWLDAERSQAAGQASSDFARTTYNVDHLSMWGWKISAYLFTKSLAAGLFLVGGLLLGTSGGQSALAGLAGAGIGALAFLIATLVLLVADLKRPERFAYILLRPNWNSWIARGSVILGLYAAFLVLWLAAVWWGAPGPVTIGLFCVGSVLAALSACYTGWLFGQARGRVLWMRRGLWLHLIVQAVVAGSGFALLAIPVLELAAASIQRLRWCLVIALGIHLLFVLTEGNFAPAQREKEYERASKLITRGPFSLRHYALGLAVGILLPTLLLLATPASWVGSLAGVLALVGLYVEKDTLVRAGQAQTIS